MSKSKAILCLIIAGYLMIINMPLISGQSRTHKATPGNRFETRCGWFENPTPSNAWLTDRDGEWIISVQGGFQADGDWPDFKPQQWILTNAGSYGYGCACIQAKLNRKTHKMLEIKSATAKSLAVCRKDRSLKEPK